MCLRQLVDTHKHGVRYLNTSYSGRQHETLVVAVHHDDDTDRACSDGPAVLMRVVTFSRLRILERDVEHLGEVLAQVMRCGRLDATARRGDVRLDGERVVATGKLLLHRLTALTHWDCQQILIDFLIQIDNVVHLKANDITDLKHITHCA